MAWNEKLQAGRVVEEPRRNLFPYLMMGAVGALLVWSATQNGPFSSSNVTKLTSKARLDRNDESSSARGDLRTLFSADDYPASAIAGDQQGTVQAELIVGVSGRVERCIVIRSSNAKSLDVATCSILQQRARFVPARDVNGMAVPDTVTTPPIVWRLED